ncbi:necrosis inducing protein [Coniella lustricola]|uniref:Necrosis inducing protein n=1 Tax=Coniella lustricola TaxID=2025994 RepID=A0A2T2ZUY7_9PEZI|nr:necrosis inducing protein [Coniella lustricola]
MAKRSDISASEVVGFPTTVASGTEGTLMEQWWPYLYVVDGCVPFPAVDAEGDTSAGLSPTGPSDGDCSSSTGQVYARAETYGGYYAIMYSWYMPKDEPNELEGALGIGHRYDWENAVVVLSSESTSATLVGMAASYHGDYNVCVGASGCASYLDGDHPLIQYYSASLILDHSLGFTTTVGGTQPLIAWDELPTVAQDALADKDWGDAIVPFLDSDFESYLEEAYGYLDI